MLIQTHKTIFLVRSLNIEYFRPAVLDDLLQVTVEVVDMNRSRITLFQQVLRDQINLVSATIHVVCVSVDSLKPIRIPIPLRQRIQN